MTMQRSMNEYEGVLFSAVKILVGAVIELGADPPKLAARFRESSDVASRNGRANEAAVNELLARLAEYDDLAAAEPAPSVIGGEQGDQPN